MRYIAGLVGLLDGVEGLVCLFQQILRKRSIRLLAVPGTAARRTEPRHNTDQFIKCFRHKVQEYWKVQALPKYLNQLCRRFARSERVIFPTSLKFIVDFG